jgi:signal transduction histidine kinase
MAVVLVLIAIGATTIVRVLIGHPTAPTATIWTNAIVPLAFLAVAFLVFGRFLRRVATPVGDLVSAANRVAEGEYSVRVEERGPPMVRTIARAFNAMTARLQSQDVQRRHLMSDIAHELRTPLAVMQGRIEGLLDGIYPRDDQRIEQLLQDTRLLARLVEDLRTLANSESGALSLQREPTDLVALLTDTVASLDAVAAERGIRIDVEGDAELPTIDVDPARLREVATNLLSNAIRHSPDGGLINVRATRGPGHLTVAVQDHGAGIGPDDLPHVFDRFFRDRRSPGSGLGLTIARALVEAHAGRIRAESQLGHGATFSFDVPLS